MSNHKGAKTSHLEVLCAIEKAAGEGFFSRELSDLRKKIEEKTFSLAVLGQFKRGKTSFINALIGEDLLPTSVIPLTSMITVLKYGEKTRLKIVYKDGREEHAEVADLALYVTEKMNPENRRNVLFAEISYPSVFLRDGVLLIDTPGVGSLYLHNSKTTYDYLKNIDAAIFLLTADQPLSREEAVFLNDVRNHAVKLFFILNKKDYLSEAELEESLIFNREVLRKELGAEQEIYPLSARWALDGRLRHDKGLLEKSSMSSFEECLREFLDTRREQVFHESVEARINALVDSAIGCLVIEREAIKAPLEVVRSKLENYRKYAEDIRREQKDAAPVIKSEIGRIISSVDSDLEEFKKEKEAAILEALEKRFCEIAGKGNEETYGQMMEFFTKTLSEAFEPFREQEEDKVRERFEKITERFTQNTNRVIGGIERLSANMFGASLSYVKPMPSLVLESRVYYESEPIYSLFSDQYKFLLPRFAFRRLLWKEIKQNLGQRLDMTCGRIRSDFLHRLDETAIKYVSSLNESVESVLEVVEASVEKGLEERNQNEGSVQRKLKELEGRIRMLKEIKEQMRLKK